MNSAPSSSWEIRAEPDQSLQSSVPEPGTTWPNQVSGEDSSPPWCTVTLPDRPSSVVPVIRSAAK